MYMLSKGKENKEKIFDVLGVDGCGPRLGGGGVGGVCWILLLMDFCASMTPLFISEYNEMCVNSFNQSKLLDINMFTYDSWACTAMEGTNGHAASPASNFDLLFYFTATPRTWPHPLIQQTYFKSM